MSWRSWSFWSDRLSALFLSDLLTISFCRLSTLLRRSRMALRASSSSNKPACAVIGRHATAANMAAAETDLNLVFREVRIGLIGKRYQRGGFQPMLLRRCPMPLAFLCRRKQLQLARRRHPAEPVPCGRLLHASDPGPGCIRCRRDHRYCLG